MREALRRMILYAEGFSEDAFFRDQRTIDAVALNVLVVGECANRLTGASRLRLPAPWERIIAVRHRIAHGYASVNPAILWGIATEGAPNLARQLDSLEER